MEQDYDLPAFFRVRLVLRAAKEHVCAWGCGKPILKGSRYEAVSYKLDGKFNYDRVHDAFGACFIRKIEADQVKQRAEFVQGQIRNNIFFGSILDEETQ